MAGSRTEVAGMREDSDRFSIQRRVKCVDVDEAADMATAERLFARLCIRRLLAECAGNPDGSDDSSSYEGWE